MSTANTGTQWLPPPDAIPLPDGDTHVWLVSLDVSEQKRNELARTLKPAELERARRYRFSRDRERFIARRGILRSIIARYLDVHPVEIRFRLTHHGKPELSNKLTSSVLRFNASHSSGWAMFAIARNRNVGVDIEHINPARADPQVASRFFALREVASLAALSGNEWATGFFNCWTRKEAYVKSIGEGLSFPLDAFEVSLAPGQPARLLSVNQSEHKAARWAMADLDAVPGYAAALVVEASIGRLRCWRWQP
jgi:4'-phosphopantetheinyl transferase